jgi:predicted ATPase
MVYVITGGPGFGKSTLISQLSYKGFRVSNEIAREVIEEQQLSGGDALPWKNVILFEKYIASRRIEFIESVTPSEIAFSDRGLPDQVAFSWYKGKTESYFLKESVKKYRYATMVFITSPWEAIFTNDQIRQESFDEACKIHLFILKAYQENGYQLFDLPLVSPAERVNFILQTINHHKTL